MLVPPLPRLALRAADPAAAFALRSEEPEPADERERDERAAGESGAAAQLAAQAAALPNSTTRILTAEREFAPQSRAFRRDAQRGVAERSGFERRERFRDALSARGKEQRAAASDGARPNHATKPDTSVARTEHTATSAAGPAPEPVHGTAAPSSRSATTPSAVAAPGQTTGAARAAINIPQSLLSAAAPEVAQAAAPTGAAAVASVSPVLSPPVANAIAPASSTGPSRSEPNASATAPPSQRTAARGPVVRGGTAPGADSAEPRENFDRVLRVLRSAVYQERGTTVVRLTPPELGSLLLRFELGASGLQLDIETESQLAQHLLSRELDQLRRGLEAAGFPPERIEIRNVGPAPETPGTPTDAQNLPDARDGGGSYGDAGGDSGGWDDGTGQEAPSAAAEPAARVETAAESRVNLVA